MDVTEHMKRHGLTDADLDAMAAPYESGSYPSGGGEVLAGSHLSAVDKRRVTVAYDARDAQRVAEIARSRGVKPSEVYREALDHYLATQA